MFSFLINHFFIANSILFPFPSQNLKIILKRSDWSMEIPGSYRNKEKNTCGKDSCRHCPLVKKFFESKSEDVFEFSGMHWEMMHIVNHCLASSTANYTYHSAKSDNFDTFDFTVTLGKLTSKDLKDISPDTECVGCTDLLIEMCDLYPSEEGKDHRCCPFPNPYKDQIQYWKKGNIVIQKAGEGELLRKAHRQTLQSLLQMKEVFCASSPNKKSAAADEDEKPLDIGCLKQWTLDCVGVECAGCGGIFCPNCIYCEIEEGHQLVCDGCHTPMCRNCSKVATDRYRDTYDFLTHGCDRKDYYREDGSECDFEGMFCQNRGCHEDYENISHLDGGSCDECYIPD